jgi:hypothetical protein
MEHIKNHWKKYAMVSILLVGMFWYKADLFELVRLVGPMIGLL